MNIFFYLFYVTEYLWVLYTALKTYNNTAKYFTTEMNGLLIERQNVTGTSTKATILINLRLL